MAGESEGWLETFERRKQDLLVAEFERCLHVFLCDVLQALDFVDEGIDRRRALLYARNNAQDGSTQVRWRLTKDLMIENALAVHAIDGVEVVLLLFELAIVLEQSFFLRI